MTSNWSVSAVPDQSDRTVVITGANSGLGFEATRIFAEKGADVVMACRDRQRAESARDEIHSAIPDSSLSVLELDLASLASVREFAEAFTDAYDDLHVLCNNAGIMAIPRQETTDGFEMQFGVNHLGHFALTAHLYNTLRETAGESRVVTHSSGLHENGDIDFDDLQGEQEYDKWDAYAQSKLANLLFAYELDRRLQEEDANVKSLGCHPGYADTGLQRRGPEMAGSTLRLWAMKVANTIVAQSAEQGAYPMVYAATSTDIDGGEYVGPGGLMNMRGTPEVQASSGRSRDEDIAASLWDVSEDLTGIAFQVADGGD